MGRELQKKKNRSSISKVKHKPKSKKRLLHHPIVAENWDKSLTFAQNYARLGLTAKLNKSTGGTDKKVSDVQREAAGERNAFSAGRDPLNIASTSRRNEKLDVTEAKIERDPETGEILRIIEQGGGARANPLNDPLNDLDSDDSSDGEEILSLRNQHGNTDSAVGGAASGKTETVRKLEAAANRPVQKYKRRQPEGEVAFIEELVAKYGEDYGKMARDTKINYMQRSEGDLKKRIKKWRESGGRID
ncbi:related to Nucleolar protein 16 [Ramularia collo-cygni]|uniref:Nucleolar protein 16 n=1 Tax=Ramularia collo-cygni TaxID=112498 RepID=A0A2D3USV1_9PEZI|nr:related to Nucleolar protein 16 [Ramularia collo-cygni]CZT16915.1 related to Nucleolar protein 16 [Ramularia collo-cygni]